MNGLAKAGIEINRKMLSDMAINEPAQFAELVKTSKAALESKTVKAETKKVEKVEANKEVKTKEVANDYSKMTLAELKAVAKEQGVKGYSTMKKDELLANIK